MIRRIRRNRIVSETEDDDGSVERVQPNEVEHRDVGDDVAAIGDERDAQRNDGVAGQNEGRGAVAENVLADLHHLPVETMTVVVTKIPKLEEELLLRMTLLRITLISSTLLRMTLFKMILLKMILLRMIPLRMIPTRTITMTLPKVNGCRILN